MRLIELHIIQSFPVSCLNRDDVGAPKSAVFGGATRARVSSQCLKRAIREMAKEISGKAFAGQRSRMIVQPIADALIAKGLDNSKALELATAAGEYLATFDKEKAEKDGSLRVKTLMFLSPAEIQAIAERLFEFSCAAQESAASATEPEAGKKKKKEDKGPGKLFEKTCKDAIKSARLEDAADIAIFGRMAASVPCLTVEGAGMFSHALSTHKADNDLDFWTAVDDRKEPGDDAGAAGMGTAEFTSACYYRYAALNLDMLADEAHLAVLSPDGRKAVVDAFIRATLMAVSSARKNSMNANTLPAYVLGIVKEHGQPIQLVNAFEKPVKAENGLADESIRLMREHHASMKTTWGIQTAVEAAIPEIGIDQFCEELTAHVK